MCGINGFIDFRNKHTKEYRHKLIHEMNDKIIYRGPDAEGIYDGRWFSMGMRRLSIVDIKSGSQPVYNEDGSIAVVFNGEIYNHKKLRSQLEKRGHIFKTHSDTEVIIHLYEESGGGISAFSKLDGMFAFSLYDQNADKLYIVRDKMGEKPLYYFCSRDYFCFSSELRSLMMTGLSDKRFDQEALKLYFAYTYIPAPYTIYEDIRKLKAGHYICIGAEGSISIQQYWDLKVDKRYTELSYQDAKQELRRLLNHSVKERMDCDVPFGVFLSGGIDSGIIAALMMKNSNVPVNTFTIGYEEKDYDESGNARWLARHLGTRHHERILSYQDSIDIVSKVVGHFDEPFADSSALPEYLVSNFASQYVRVVLTGDGGDEMFLGYDKYAVDYYVKKYLSIPKPVRCFIESMMEKVPDKSVLTRKVHKVLGSAYIDEFSRRKKLMQLGFQDEDIENLFMPDYISAERDDLISHYYMGAPGEEELSRTQYTDIKVVLEGDMLTKVDRMTMYNSLESRAPMLSSNVVRFGYSIPDEYKLNGRDKKKILKESFRDLIPKGYEKLPKIGFGVPLDHWFRNEMRSELTDLLSYDRIKKQGIFHADYVTGILKEHLTGRINRKSELWCLYVFEKWFEKEYV